MGLYGAVLIGVDDDAPAVVAALEQSYARVAAGLPREEAGAFRCNRRTYRAAMSGRAALARHYLASHEERRDEWED